MPSIEERLAPYEMEMLRVYFALFFAGVLMLLLHLRHRWRQVAADWAGVILRVSCRPWTVVDAAGVVGVVLGTNLAYGWLMRHRANFEEFSTLAVGMALTHGVILAVIVVLLFARRLRARDAFGGGSHRFLGDLRTGCEGFLAMYVIVLPAMIATGILLKLLDRPEQVQDVVNLIAMQDTLFKRVYFAVWTVLVAPVAEEMLFRGILLPLALRRVPPLAAMLLVSFGFAWLHQSETAFLPLLAVSMSLCLAFLATESLVVTITMHALFNALTVTFLFLAA